MTERLLPVTYGQIVRDHGRFAERSRASASR
jgi:hypothetical protein